MFFKKTKDAPKASKQKVWELMMHVITFDKDNFDPKTVKGESFLDSVHDTRSGAELALMNREILNCGQTLFYIVETTKHN